MMQSWSIHFGWVKAHAGVEGNELVDRLTQEAAEDDGDLRIVCNRKPTTIVASELKKEGLTKWQRQWDNTDRGALCRLFFPTVEQRLKLKIPVTLEFSAIVSGHGKTKSYLHRFKFVDNAMCPCNGGAQTPDHLIYDCEILEVQRKTMKQHIQTSEGNWPTTNMRLDSKIFTRICKIY
jgi:hypothetical protein